MAHLALNLITEGLEPKKEGGRGQGEADPSEVLGRQVRTVPAMGPPYAGVSVPPAGHPHRHRARGPLIDHLVNLVMLLSRVFFESVSSLLHTMSLHPDTYSRPSSRSPCPAPTV